MAATCGSGSSSGGTVTCDATSQSFYLGDGYVPNAEKAIPGLSGVTDLSRVRPRSRGNSGVIVDYGRTPPNDKLPMKACEGDCDTDTECSGDLKCFQRDKVSDLVPGCGTSGYVSSSSAHDYCYDPVTDGPTSAGSFCAGENCGPDDFGDDTKNCCIARQPCSADTSGSTCASSAIKDDAGLCAGSSCVADDFGDANKNCCIARQQCSADTSGGICATGTIKDDSSLCNGGACGAEDFGDDTTACCFDNTCENTDGSLPFDGTDRNGKEAKQCACIQGTYKFNCFVGYACDKRIIQKYDYNPCITPHCPNQVGTKAFEGFTVVPDMQNIQGQGFNNQQKCACGTPTGQGLNSVYKVCKLGEFCEPVDKNSPKSNCKKSSKDDIAAVEEEAAKVAAEEEKRLAKQSADMQNNNSDSSDGGYWWTFGSPN